MVIFLRYVFGITSTYVRMSKSDVKAKIMGILCVNWLVRAFALTWETSFFSRDPKLTPPLLTPPPTASVTRTFFQASPTAPSIPWTPLWRRVPPLWNTSLQSLPRTTKECGDTWCRFPTRDTSPRRWKWSSACKEPSTLRLTKIKLNGSWGFFSAKLTPLFRSTKCEYLDGSCLASPRWVSLLVAEIYYPDTTFPNPANPNAHGSRSPVQGVQPPGVSESESWATFTGSSEKVSNHRKNMREIQLIVHIRA